ncbi:hypothetical protein [Streptomyces flavofungini]|uniref:Uncharacterized protein n=1 Tax=Streptomyces flavofungini TaxID=68200 RepID=A0ABS0X0E2_9ACTN|nr:hypothetical protein [Streptomyces flavofungini]MBJ3806653.1 hypothetical protein [Streptomyces flavofungini]GHC61467.1 hypothetical protein GCM10010349_31320 [Streptomyces flavofungini]
MSSENDTAQRMQLAQTDPAWGGAGETSLASSATDKKRAVRFMENRLLPDTKAAGRMAEGGGQVHAPLAGPGSPQGGMGKPDTGLSGGLSSWATYKGLSDAMAVWQGQTSALLGRLHQEMNGLRGAKNALHSPDADIGFQVAGIGVLRRPASAFDRM